MRRLIAGLALILGLLVIAVPIVSRAQFGDVLQKAKEKAAQKAKEAMDKKRTKEGNAPETAPTSADSAGTATASPSAELKPGEGVWLNYDFVPGNRVLFFDDFTGDEVGNFPHRLELREGNMEVADWKGSRWLRASTSGTMLLPLADVLPERFTLEFDYYAPWEWNSIEVACDLPDDTPERGAFTKAVFSTFDKKAGLRSYDNARVLAYGALAEGAGKLILHCRVMADGKYMKVYANETRVANFPSTSFGRSKALAFRFVDTDENRPAMIGNVRVAASDKRLYDALVAAGRVATQGILFDTGSDRIRPESTPTLKEIGQMLKDHPDLKLRIEGHTDNVGDAASNLALSERRAGAVRTYLVGQGGIEDARLQVKGFGQTKPVSSNDSAEGRQNNRRVELVKL